MRRPWDTPIWKAEAANEEGEPMVEEGRVLFDFRE
jgi:hypothetical protein